MTPATNTDDLLLTIAALIARTPEAGTDLALFEPKAEEFVTQHREAIIRAILPRLSPAPEGGSCSEWFAWQDRQLRVILDASFDKWRVESRRANDRIGSTSVEAGGRDCLSLFTWLNPWVSKERTPWCAILGIAAATTLLPEIDDRAPREGQSSKADLSLKEALQ